jgi:hypothetical protein
MVVILKVLPLGKPGNGWVQMNDRHYIR